MSLPPPIKKLTYENYSAKFSHLSDEHQSSSFSISSSSRWKAKLGPEHPICTRVWLLLRALPRPLSSLPAAPTGLVLWVQAGSRASEYEWRMLGLWEDQSGVSLSLLLPDSVLANQLSEEKNSE